MHNLVADHSARYYAIDKLKFIGKKGFTVISVKPFVCELALYQLVLSVVIRQQCQQLFSSGFRKIRSRGIFDQLS